MYIHTYARGSVLKTRRKLLYILRSSCRLMMVRARDKDKDRDRASAASPLVCTVRTCSHQAVYFAIFR